MGFYSYLKVTGVYGRARLDTRGRVDGPCLRALEREGFKLVKGY
jgi:hypothetical protein